MIYNDYNDIEVYNVDMKPWGYQYTRNGENYKRWMSHHIDVSIVQTREYRYCMWGDRDISLAGVWDVHLWSRRFIMHAASYLKSRANRTALAPCRRQPKVAASCTPTATRTHTTTIHSRPADRLLQYYCKEVNTIISEIFFRMFRIFYTGSFLTADYARRTYIIETNNIIC